MNFQDIPFLAQGSGPLTDGGPIVGQLDPWPGTPAPTKAVCTAGAGGAAPIVSAGTNITVAAGSLVTLSGTAKLDPNSVNATITWTAPAGVTLQNSTTLTPSFLAPNTPGNLLFTLTVTDQFGTGTASVSVTVNPAGDTVTVTATWIAGAVQNRPRRPPRNRNQGAITITATSTDPTATLTAQTILLDGTVLPLGTLSPIGNPAGTFTANIVGTPQPFSVTVRSNRGGTATQTCGTVNAKGVTCP